MIMYVQYSKHMAHTNTHMHTEGEDSLVYNKTTMMMATARRAVTMARTALSATTAGRRSVHSGLGSA